MKQLYKILLFTLFLSANVGMSKCMEEPDYSTWNEVSIQDRINELIAIQEQQEILPEKVQQEYDALLNELTRRKKFQEKKPLPIDKPPQAPFTGRLSVPKRGIGPKKRRPKRISLEARKESRKKLEEIPSVEAQEQERIQGAEPISPGISEASLQEQALKLKKTSEPKEPVAFTPQRTEKPALPRVATGDIERLGKTPQPGIESKASEEPSELQAKLARLKKVTEKKTKPVRVEPVVEKKEAFLEKEKAPGGVEPILQEPTITAEPAPFKESELPAPLTKTVRKERPKSGIWDAAKSFLGLGAGSESGKEKVESHEETVKPPVRPPIVAGTGLPQGRVTSRTLGRRKSATFSPKELKEAFEKPEEEERPNIGNVPELPTFVPGEVVSQKEQLEKEEQQREVGRKRLEGTLARLEIQAAEKKERKSKKEALIKQEEEARAKAMQSNVQQEKMLVNALIDLHGSLNHLLRTLSRGHAI